MFDFLSVGSQKNQDLEPDVPEVKEQTDIQAIQNHNLLIALGGVVRGGTAHFPLSVSVVLEPNSHNPLYN